MKRLTIIALITGTALAGCATAPDKVAATAAPQGAYSGLSCQQLRAEHTRETARLASLSADQRRARDTQAGAVLLGGVIGLAVTKDLDKAPEIAASKGRIGALDARLGGCK